MYNNNSVICVLFNSRSKKFKKMVENLENLLTFLNNLDYLDIFIYIFIVYLIYFGWKKGSVLIIYYLIAFLISIYLSFTYSFSIGEYISGWLNSNQQTSQIFAGVAIFITILTLSSIFQNLIYREGSKKDIGNKLLGSITSIVLSNLVLTFMFTILSLLSLPKYVQENIDQSNIISFYLSSEGVPQQTLEVITGTDLLKVTSRIKELTGSTSISLNESGCLEIPSFTQSKLISKTSETNELFEMVNIERINVNSDPLEFSQTLSNIAENYAKKMYTEGFWCHKDPNNGYLVTERLLEVGYPPPKFIGENLAMASTIYSGHQSLMNSESHRATIIDNEFKRIGIGIVSGPNGLIIVQIFA